MKTFGSDLIVNMPYFKFWYCVDKSPPVVESLQLTIADYDVVVKY